MGGRSNWCMGTQSMRQMSWFSCSNLSLGEVIIISYDIMKKVPSEAIDDKYNLEDHTRSNWF